MNMRNWAASLAAVGGLALGLSVAAPAYAVSDVVVQDQPCNIFGSPFKCEFSGNIALNAGSLGDVDDAYNGQDPDVDPDLDLSSYLVSGLTGSLDGGDDIKDGTVDAGFLVDFFAVKAGNGFWLYKLDGTDSSFDWDTSDLDNKDLSHLVYFGRPCDGECDGGGGGGGPIPEPGTWALMILGFGGAGAMLRRRRTATV